MGSTSPRALGTGVAIFGEQSRSTDVVDVGVSQLKIKASPGVLCKPLSG